MLNKKILLAFAFFYFFIIFYLLNIYKNWDWPYSKIIRSQRKIDDKFPIVFYHEAIIDERYSPPRLRIFTFNPCISENETISVFFKFRNQKVESLELSGIPTEGECPWHWASQCFYNSYIFYSDFNQKHDVTLIEKIYVKLGKRKIKLKLKIIENKKINGLTVCVQPVYWYSSFQNIILFFESWLSQGATHFIVYFHSSTSDVYRVLKFYETKGILRILSWPKFGNLPFFKDKIYPKIDASTYRVGHTLAQNLCILEMKTYIGTIVDFDEVITAKNQSILDYSNAHLSSNHYGALLFSHLLVKLLPRIEINDFSGTLKPIFLNRAGPPKVVFNTSLVDIILTHSVQSFIGQYFKKKISMKDGALLHYRQNSYSENAEEIHRGEFKLFNSNSLSHLQNIHHNLKVIFDGKIPKNDPILIETLNECISKLKKEKICRSTIFYCKQKMESLSKWIYEEKSGIFLS